MREFLAETDASCRRPGSRGRRRSTSEIARMLAESDAGNPPPCYL
jgi:hypothetical protein